MLRDIALSCGRHLQRISANSIRPFGQSTLDRVVPDSVALLPLLPPSVAAPGIRDGNISIVSVNEHSAVHVDDGARDVAGQVGGQKQTGTGDILGFAETGGEYPSGSPASCRRSACRR